MTNRYRNLLDTIPVPAGLNERVLSEARRRHAVQQNTSEETRALRQELTLVECAPRLEALPARETRGTAKSRLAPVRQKRSQRPFLLRTAVCAACALTLLLGGLSLRPAMVPESPGVPSAEGETLLPLVPTFGLTAYAAGTDFAYGPTENGGIAFATGDGMVNPDEGDYTGCLFQITGEHIAQIRLSIDRGGLYRYRLLDNLTEEELSTYRQAMAEGKITTAAISQRDDGSWYMPEMTLIGSEAVEDYDPANRYGFWISPEDMAINTGLGISTEAQMDADQFEGARLTVTVISPDGTERSQTYLLHSGSLKVQWTEENYLTVLPELAGPEDPFVYGIYAVPEGQP